MKKILAIVTMAAMVAGAAFADPEADFNLAEVTGNASVTWGVDLDNSTTGFKNDTSATVKLNLVNKGTKSTSGEGIWAELGVKYDGALQIKSENGGPAFDGGTASIDVAKLHFYNFYVGIKSDDTLVGKLELPNAVRSAWEALSDVVEKTSHDQGIVLGYGDNKNINFEFDFRSNKAPSTPAVDGTKAVIVSNGTALTTLTETAAVAGSGAVYDATKKTFTAETGYTIVKEFVVGASAAGADNYYTNDYGLAAQFKLLDSNEFVNGLFATVGGSFQFNKKALGVAASAGYKLALNDTFYVKPVVGWTMAADLSAEKITPAMKLAGGLVFGWGDETDAKAGVYYLDNDQAKKVIPGVGVNVLVPLNDSDPIIITPSFYSGSIVENLTAAATADISIPKDGGAAGIAVAGGLKYAIAATDSVTVTPQVGARFATKGFTGAAKFTDKGTKSVWTLDNTDNGGVKDNVDAATVGLLNIKAGLDVAGLINNTTFSVWYQSRNLLQSTAGAAKIGTINVQCKISF